jgi:hypothetical protein
MATRRCRDETVEAKRELSAHETDVEVASLKEVPLTCMSIFSLLKETSLKIYKKGSKKTNKFNLFRLNSDHGRSRREPTSVLGGGSWPVKDRE